MKNMKVSWNDREAYVYFESKADRARAAGKLSGSGMSGVISQVENDPQCCYLVFTDQRTAETAVEILTPIVPGDDEIKQGHFESAIQFTLDARIKLGFAIDDLTEARLHYAAAAMDVESKVCYEMVSLVEEIVRRIDAAADDGLSMESCVDDPVVNILGRKVDIERR
jgi:hypothetical protein